MCRTGWRLLRIDVKRNDSDYFRFQREARVDA